MLAQLRILDEQLAEKSLGSRMLTSSPLIFCALAFIAGIVTANNYEPPFMIPFSGLFLCAASCVLSQRLKTNRQKFRFAIFCGCLCFFCLGFIRLYLFKKPASNDIRNLVGTERIMAEVKGRVISELRYDDPTTWKFGRYQWSEPGTSFYLKLTEIKTNKGWSHVKGVVRVQVSGWVTDIDVGNQIKVYCWLDRFSTALNPGQFDIKKYLANRGVYIGASVKTADGIEVINRSSLTSFRTIRHKLATFTSGALLDESFTETQSYALLEALLLGKRGNIEPEITKAFQDTGLSHFISLSGLHVGILAASIWFFAKVLGMPKPFRAVMCLLLIALYAIIVPTRAPTLRAAFLCWFFCISVIVRRHPNPLNTLSLAAIVLLLIRPTDVFTAGFQLSYATVFGILIFEKNIRLFLEGIFINNALVKRISNDSFVFIIFQKITLYTLALFSVGLSAWIGGAGVMLYHFGNITFMTTLWTMAVFPFVFLILIFGFVKIILSSILPTIALLMGVTVNRLCGIVIEIVRFFSDLGISGILIGKVSVFVIILYYLFILLLRFSQFSRLFVKKAVFCGLASAFIIPIIFIKYKSNNRNELELCCLSVGHGQAIAVAFPGRANILFDAGSISTKNPGERIVVPFLKHQGINHLDAIILSHDDMDHINGIPEITAQCDVKGIYANDAFLEKASRTSMAGYLNSCLYNENILLKTLEHMAIPESGGQISFLWPDKKTCQETSISNNDKSQAILLEYSGRKILICSDIELYAQQKILELYPELTADAIIMPHHGSTRNLNENFLERINAEIIIVSCSRSRYESAYKSETRKVFYTPVDGAVSVKIKADGTIHAAGFASKNKTILKVN